MSVHQLELIKRLNREAGLASFLKCTSGILAQAAFDEDAVFDLMIEEENGQRLEKEIVQREFPSFFKQETWPGIHRVLLSNQWVKGMNIKLQWVKRVQSTAVTLKWEMSQADALKAAAPRLERFLNELDLSEPECVSQPHAERERLFGAMLLAESVARRARADFLAGDFSGALASAYGVLVKRLEKLLGIPLKKREDVEAVFHQDPPCILMPDLSGPRLQLELVAWARLWSGLELLLQPVLHGWEKAPDDPGAVLKKIVLISMLVERLEDATVNPAAIRRSRKAKTPAPASRRPKKSTAPRSQGRARKTGKTSKVKVKARSKRKTR